MDTNTLIILILVGAAAGWLAGEIRRGYGFGLGGNIVVGIVGSFLGRWLFNQLGVGVGGGLLGAIFVALIGALVLLFLIGLIRRT
jgi:uncharacterized membrane protein YeaQ/YmgE (transglycosylase-associated protein family)